jgi:hypothetical protein
LDCHDPYNGWAPSPDGWFRAATRWIHYHDPIKTANSEGRKRVIG